MPNKPTKKEQDKISEGVKKEVNQWEDTGKITTSRAEYHPKTKEKAVKQSLAIEYGKQGVGRAGSKNKQTMK